MQLLQNLKLCKLLSMYSCDLEAYVHAFYMDPHDGSPKGEKKFPVRVLRDQDADLGFCGLSLEGMMSLVQGLLAL